MRYSFCTKTTYDPANGLDIKAFKSKTNYLADPRVDIKVLSIVDLASGTPMSFYGVEGARAAMQAISNATTPDIVSKSIWISHTTFHLEALQAKMQLTLPGQLVLLDELARQQDPSLRSVAFQSLLDRYIPGIDRHACPLIEGGHNLAELTRMNERDATLMAGLYLKFTGEAA